MRQFLKHNEIKTLNDREQRQGHNGLESAYKREITLFLTIYGGKILK